MKRVREQVLDGLELENFGEDEREDQTDFREDETDPPMTEAELADKVSQLSYKGVFFPMTDEVSPSMKIMAQAGLMKDGGDGLPRVKVGSELYNTKREIGRHAKTGQPVYPRFLAGQPAELPSDYELAKAGAFFKWRARQCGLQVELSEQDKLLFRETVDRDAWSGLLGAEWVTGLRGARVKAILDDSTSGGANLSPDWFDTRIVTYPLLTGELFSYVELVNVPRSATVDGATVSAPTVTWGTADGTAQDVFDTASLIGALSNTIHRVAVHV